MFSIVSEIELKHITQQNIYYNHSQLALREEPLLYNVSHSAQAYNETFPI